MKEKKIIKSITLYKIQESAIQSMADDICEGNFGQAIRSIIDVWMTNKENKK